ncbi:MAG TPA: SemiSWEET transporter [Holophaga sp.]|nr:SemiSWEET transporter [Holophaga sp.]
MVEYIGFIAAFLTTFSFLPQVVKVWRTRSAEDLSLVMYLMFTTGVFLWLVYGFRIRSAPVAAANAVTLVLALSILVAKVRYGGRKAGGPPRP